MEVMAKLKQHRPAVVVAYDRDDEPTKINVPDVRKKFERVMTTLEDLAWVKLDMLDKKGGLLCRHVRQLDETETLVLPPGAVVDGNDLTKFAGLAHVLVRSQDAAVERVLAATRQTDALQAELRQTRADVNALGELVQQLVNELVALRQPDPSDDRPHSDRVIDSLLPAVVRAALAGDAPTSDDEKDREPPNSSRRSHPRPVSPDPERG